MIIKKLELRNINSYGNNLQTIEFDQDGGLICLQGKNGSGKSTLKMALELCIFGKVQGKTGKRLALSKLPNRRNNALYTGVYFQNNVMDEIVMKRFISPNNFSMTFNNEDHTEKFKKMSDKEREKIIGYSYDVFKSFISLNINDFKNFISLSKEDKENLLNKLFNLSQLDVLQSIVKELDKSNIDNTNKYEDIISENDQKITELRQTLLTIKNKQELSKEEKLKTIKESILSKKPIYDGLIIKIKECDTINLDINTKSGKLIKIRTNKEKERAKYDSKIELIKEKLSAYQKGVCPVCDTDLKDNSHLEHMDEIQKDLQYNEEELKKCDLFLERCILEDVKLRNANTKNYGDKISYGEQIAQLKAELATLNKQYKEIKDSEDTVSTEEIENNIISIKERNKEVKSLLNALKEKSDIYSELNQLFSFDGIRKSIISNALRPINKNLDYFLTKLDSEYKAKLNDNFDATIYELETLEVDPETLSKGEDRKINIAIALSYLKLILEMRHTNIMFLDEVFDGVDGDNIDLILKLLKEIALEYKINIIIVNHSKAELSNFHTVIKVKKDIFSNIEIHKNLTV